MSRRLSVRSAAIVVTVVLSSGLRASSPQQAGFRTIERGIELFDGDLTVVRVSQGRRAYLVVPLDPAGASSTLSGYARREEARATLSGGFLRSYVPPLPAGLVVRSGRLLNAAIGSDSAFNALVSVDAGGVVRISRMPQGPEADGACPAGASCIQTGPLLMSDGERVRLSLRPRIRSARAERSFVAVDTAGRVLLGWASARTLDSLVGTLSALGNPFAIRWAAGLSGDVNCGLLLNARGAWGRLWGDSTSLLPNVFVVR